MTGAVFAKRRADAPAGFFGAEAAGLAWLAQVDGGARVARPVAVRENGIDLERLTETGASAAAAEDLGRRLAVTHAAGAPAFGSPPNGWAGPGWIGMISLPYGRFDTWGAFYAEVRLLPYAREAVDSGALSEADVRAVDAVCAKLTGGEWDDGRPPARLHGDLWSGNVLWCADGAVLIDPAAHGGHAETDLAMLALFGLPHLERVLAAYDEATPLAAGWRDRVGLHQLHPLLVHAVLFGGGYGARAGEVARRYA